MKFGVGGFAALFVSCAVAVSPAQAQYRLQAGDVVEIAVAGFPDLRQKSAINIDGDLMLPLVGQVQARGSTVWELSQRVKQGLSSKVLQQRTPDGRSNPVVIGQDEITLIVVDYRPVYLSGDVGRPGEQPFRPGMTVRQAIAVAGGYDLVRSRSGNPVAEAAQLRGDLQTFAVDYVKAKAAVWRLKSELGQAVTDDLADLSKLPVAKEVVTQIAENEKDALRSRREDTTREKAFLQTVIRQADARLALLREQQRNEEEGIKVDQTDYDRVNSSYERGMAAVNRVSDARRSMLLSATRVLQTSSAAEQLKREREELRKNLAGYDDKRRIQVLNELQDAGARLAQSQAKIMATQEQLISSGMSRSQLTSGGSRYVTVAIVRTVGKTERFNADEDVALMPGGAVEVTLDVRRLLEMN